MRLLIILFSIIINANALDVTEVFSLNCGHCYSVEPQVEQLAQDPRIKIISVPLYDQSNINHVGAISSYFAAKSLGKEWAFRKYYFNAIFAVGYEAYSPAALKYTLTKIGLNTPSFYKLASSREIIEQMNNAVNLAIKYNVSGTPTFIVNGRFYEGENALQEIFSK